MKLNDIKDAVTRSGWRSSLIAQKYSPEILIGAGIIGVITASVLAARSTLKLEEVVDNAKVDLGGLDDAYNDQRTHYSESSHRKDVAKVYLKTGVSLVKLYGPSISIGAVSIACLIGSHGIMQKRNTALTAAYVTVDNAYKAYRERVANEYGEEKEHNLYNGTHDEIERDENGKKTKTLVKVVDDPNHISPHARFFDESCPNWEHNSEYNMLFLTGQQNYANDLLHARGHIFLNEIYDNLGIPRTKEGSIVGWIMKKGGNNFVDFGIFDVSKPKSRDFVNGYERSILLEFNVDGVIWDQI